MDIFLDYAKNTVLLKVFGNDFVTYKLFELSLWSIHQYSTIMLAFIDPWS